MTTLANTMLVRWFVTPLCGNALPQSPIDGLLPTREGTLFLDQILGRFQRLGVHLPSAERLAQLIKSSSPFSETLPRFLERLGGGREAAPRNYDAAVLTSGLKVFGLDFLSQHAEVVAAGGLRMEKPEPDVFQPDIKSQIGAMALPGITVPEPPSDLEALTALIEAPRNRNPAMKEELEAKQITEWQRLQGAEKLLRMAQTGDKKTLAALRRLDPNRLRSLVIGKDRQLPWEASLALLVCLAAAGNPLAAGYLYRHAVGESSIKEEMLSFYTALYGEPSLFRETLEGFQTKPAAAYLFRSFTQFFNRNNNFWIMFLPIEPGLEEWFAQYEPYLRRFREEETELYGQLQAAAIRHKNFRSRDYESYEEFQRLLWRAYQVIVHYDTIPKRYDPDELIG